MNLELKVPPLAVVGSAALGMVVTAYVLPALGPGGGFLPASELRWGLAGLCVGLGAYAGASGVLTFRRIGTTVNPMRPDRVSSLVIEGIYQRTRNPMYVAMMLGLLALGFGLNHAASLVWVPLFVLYMNRFQIAVEERFLAQKYGEEFQRYCEQVRRWL